MALADINPFSKKSPQRRKDDLLATRREFAETIEAAQRNLAALVAKTGDPLSAEAERLGDEMRNRERGLVSIEAALAKVDSEIAEAEAKRAASAAKKAEKLATEARGERAIAALEFDKCAAALEQAFLRVRETNDAASRSGTGMKAVNLGPRVVNAFHDSAPTLYQTILKRGRVGLSPTNAHRTPLAATFAAPDAE